MKNKSVKTKLKRGDYQTVADLTGFSRIYVRMVINGLRKNDVILSCMKKLHSGRKQLRKSIKSELRATQRQAA